MLSQSPLSPDTFIALSLDIKEFFPSAHRQVLFDMLAGCAPQDYPSTSVKKGDAMPTHSSLRVLLPLAGVSQGCGTGSGLASIQAHFAVHQDLLQHPDAAVTV